VFLISGLSGLALPGLGSFVSEFLVITGTFQRYKGAAVISSVGLVMSAIYILWMYKRVMTGPTPTLAEPVNDLTWREKFVVAPLDRVLHLPRVLSEAALDVVNPAVQRVLSVAGVSDPAPATPAAATTGE
jgi:NADH-quinone oxidoreductase subunit M